MATAVYAAPLPQTTATCNGTLYRDDNGNGAFDGGEPVAPASRVEIYDATEMLLGEAVTDGDGNWSVSGLPIGTQIRVQVKTPLPGGLIEGPVGADSAGFVVFTDTNNCTDLTFGALLVSACSNLCLEVGNRVWFDENPDGLQNAHEQGIAGVTVSIYDSSDQLVAQTVTDADGDYYFTCLDGLEPNSDYDIRLDNADDYTGGGPLFETFLTQAFQGIDPQIDSVGSLNKDNFPAYAFTTGEPGQAVHYIDFGFTPPATIGDTVWFDVNGNAIQDTYDMGYSDVFTNMQGIDFKAMLPPAQTGIAESGIPNITVNLYGAGADNVVGTPDDDLLDSQVTDGLGQYRFRPLQPGLPYRVEVDVNTLPGLMVASYDEDGAGDHNIVINALTAGQQHMTADFGYTGGVDLGIHKQADFPDWRPRTTVEWTVVVTNYGSLPAPNVVVADAMGGSIWKPGENMWDKQELEAAETSSGDTRGEVVDVILGRIFELFWSYDPDTGNYKSIPDVGSEAEAEALIHDWLINNVTVDGGADWSCTWDYNLFFPGGIPLDQAHSEEGPGFPVDIGWYYDDLGLVIQDIQLYYLCTLNEDLAPGAVAAPIVFSIGNEFNRMNHQPDTVGLPSYALIGGWDEYPSRYMGTTETNYARTESFFGAEPFGTYPNQDSATIDGIGDLQWDKTLVNSADAPFDIDEDMVWLITITNVGSVPWYDGIFMQDNGSYAYIISGPNAPWQCDPIYTGYTVAGQRDNSTVCFHPAIPGGLAAGESITAMLTSRLYAFVGSAPTANSLKNYVSAQYETSQDDDRTNNSDNVPFTGVTTAWTVSKGSPVIVDGDMEWTINHNVTPSDIPAGQVFVMEERLHKNMPLHSVVDNGWQCEAKTQGRPANCPTCSDTNYKICWFEPISTTVTIPPLVIRTAYIDGLSNTACPGRGIRFGPHDWNFALNSGPCDASPVYSGVPIAPTDMALTKEHDLSTEPWIRGSTGTFKLTISELNIGPDRPVVEDVLQFGLSLLDVRNDKGESLITASGDPVAGTGWSCTSNITPNDLRIFLPSQLGSYTDLLQCIGDEDLHNATDYLYIDVEVTTDAADFVHNDAAVEGLTRAEPRKTTSNLPFWELNDLGTVDNDDEDEVPVPSPDLQIAKSHVAPVFAGVPFDFTIIVTNNNDFSGIAAGDPIPYGAPLPLPVHVTDTFPIGLDYLGFSGTDWTCSSDGAAPPTVSCSYGSAGQSLLSGNSAAPLTIQAIAPGVSVGLTNNAAAVWTDQSPIIFYSQTPDNTTDEIIINIPFVESTKTSSQPQTLVGDATTETFDFYLTIENTQGYGPALGPVRITDNVPAAFNINSITPDSDWDCSASAGQLVDCLYTPGNFPLGTTDQVIVNVTVDGAASAGQVQNTMVASHGGIQALTEEMTSTRSINILRYADLTVGKARDIIEPNPGDTIAYTVVMTNTGPSNAQGVQILDYIPYGGFYIDNQGSDPAWSCSSNGGTPELVTCDLTTDLPVGNGPPLILRMGLTADAFPGVSNFITIRSNTATSPGFTGQPYALDEYMAITGCIGDYVWLDVNEDGVEEGSAAGPDGLFDTLDDLFNLVGPGLDGLMSTPDDSTHGFQNVELELLWAGLDDIFGTGDDVNMGRTQTDGTGYYAFEFIPSGSYTVTVDTGTGMLAADSSPLSSYNPTYDYDSGTTNPDNSTGVTVGDSPTNWIRADIDFGYFSTSDTPEIALSKTLNSAEPVAVGQSISFTIRITNIGTAVITTLPLTDTYDNSYMAYDSANGSTPATVDNISDGQLEWSDLTETEGDLAPGEVIEVIVRFTALADTSALAAQVPCVKAGESCNVAAVNNAKAGTTPVPPVEDSDDVIIEEQSTGKSTLGDFVWFDTNSDGIKDPGETGINGVIINLYDSTGLVTTTVTMSDTDGIGDDTGTTNGDGFYDFQVLPSTVYTVEIDPGNFAPGGVLEGYFYTGNNAVQIYNGDEIRVVGMPPVQHDENNVDFGYVTHSLGNYVWIDDDNSGDVTAGESPAPDGVVIELLDSNGTVVMTTTTTSGYYLFDGIAAGDYQVRVAASNFQSGGLLENHTDSTGPAQEADPNSDGDQNDNGMDGGVLTTDGILSALVTVGGTEPIGETPTASGTAGDDSAGTPDVNSNLTLDFGIRPPMGSIGDTIWGDMDEDGDGVLDGSDVPLAGVVVELELPNGSTITTTTDISGTYLFPDLPYDTYTVTVDVTTLPPGYLTIPSYDPDGTPDSTSVVTLDGITPNNLDQDFSYPPDVQPVLIGNRVWIEDDNDGLATTGVITPVIGSVVTAIGSDGTIYTATTDVMGYYTLTVPASDTYTVTVGTPLGTAVAVPTGGLIASDSDPATNDDTSHDPDGTVVAVDSNDNLTIDFGFYTLMTGFELSKVLNTPPPARVGEIVSFTIRITNTGATVMTTVPLMDNYNSAYLKYMSGSPEPDSADLGQLVWNDLTAAGATGFGMGLNPGETFEVVVEFLAMLDTTGQPNDSTANIAISEDVTDSAEVPILAPTSVTLAIREVIYENGNVMLRWETADETDVVGFHIYRGLAGNEEDDPVQITKALLVAQKSGSSSGAVYTYEDETARASIDYRYFVGILDTNDLETRSLLGDVSVQRTFNEWFIFLPITLK